MIYQNATSACGSVILFLYFQENGAFFRSVGGKVSSHTGNRVTCIIVAYIPLATRVLNVPTRTFVPATASLLPANYTPANLSQAV